MNSKSVLYCLYIFFNTNVENKPCGIETQNWLRLKCIRTEKRVVRKEISLLLSFIGAFKLTPLRV